MTERKKVTSGVDIKRRNLERDAMIELIDSLKKGDLIEHEDGKLMLISTPSDGRYIEFKTAERPEDGRWEVIYEANEAKRVIRRRDPDYVKMLKRFALQ